MDPRLRKHLGDTGQLGNSVRRQDYGSGLGHTSRKPQHLGSSTTTSSSSGHLNDRMEPVVNYEQEPQQLQQPSIAPPSIVARPLPPTFVQNGKLPHVSQQLNGLGNSKRGMGGFGKKMGVGLLAAGVGVGVWWLLAGKDGDTEGLKSADDFMKDILE